MKIKTFSIPVIDPEPYEKEANAFLGGRRVIDVRYEFVADGINSRWCLFVKYLDGPVRHQGPASSPSRKQVDYKNILDEAAFARFSLMRRARKTLADREGVPAYAVLTDRQMAELAGFENPGLEELGGIKGIGPGKVEKYGPAFFELFRADSPGTPETDEDEADGKSV